MNNTNKEKFESLWTDFTALVRGKLLAAAQKQTLSTPLANLILADAVSSWISEYDINGRWLMKYMEEDHPKAELVKDVLMNDMKFNEVKIKKALPDYYNYVIPAIGAGVGYASGYFLGLGKIAQTLSAVTPAVLLFPAVKMFRKSQREANVGINVDLYMEQLKKYRDSVLAIIS